MVTLTVALEDMKTQLAEAVRGAVEKGFELIAGVVGAKLAKSMEGAVKNAEVVGKGGGHGDMAGLREQIKDNATILIPLMDAHSRNPTCGAQLEDSKIRIVISGNSSTGGMRAMLFDDSRAAKPKLIFWSYKHATVTGALKDLLDRTQYLLKFHLAALVDPPSPTTAPGLWGPTPAPSFNTPSPTDSAAATAGAPDTSGKGDKLFWDAGMVTNPSFGGFDYGSFDTVDSGFDSDDATCVDPAMHS